MIKRYVLSEEKIAVIYQHKMNMKQKYGEIPVPAHARDRMLAGIRQAKEEKERSVSRVISLEDRKGRKNMKNHVL